MFFLWITPPQQPPQHLFMIHQHSVTVWHLQIFWSQLVDLLYFNWWLYFWVKRLRKVSRIDIKLWIWDRTFSWYNLATGQSLKTKEIFRLWMKLLIQMKAESLHPTNKKQERAGKVVTAKCSVYCCLMHFIFDKSCSFLCPQDEKEACKSCKTKWKHCTRDPLWNNDKKNQTHATESEPST